MKLLRLTGILLLVVAGITLALSLILPARQTIDRTISIKAPASVVYKYISRLEHFNNWAVWGRNDSTVTYERSGEDGAVGAVSSWSGDPVLSGTGKIELTALEENKQVTQKIHFLSPRDGMANSVLSLEENKGVTTVRWHFEMLTPRPWNVFNLFYKMEKEMGKDFEEGLLNLKTEVEKAEGKTTRRFEVTPVNYPATTYAIVRQEIRSEDIGTYLDKHWNMLGDPKESKGPLTALYFGWYDESSSKIDVAAAVPVNPGDKWEGSVISEFKVPASKAIYVDVSRGKSDFSDAFASLAEYLRKENLKRKLPQIEQYIVNPYNEPDPSRHQIRIIYLVE
jgi:hypothetical protein